MPNYVPGTGSLTPKLMIIGEAPGRLENEYLVPFVGPTGQILDECLFKAGIKRSECYITNVVKYQPPFNDFEKLHLIGVDLDQSIRELWENEISKLRPNCILAVGDHALHAVTGNDGILNWRGSIIKARDGITKCVPTIHPAALFSRSTSDNESSGGLAWTWLKLIEHDINRAGEESLTPELNLPHRDLSVAHSSLELYRFFNEYESLLDCCVDIESINGIPVCYGFAFNRHHGISVPILRQIGKHKLTDMGDREMNEVWRLIDDKLRTLHIIGQNFKYDHFRSERIGFEIPHVKSDTLIKTRVIFPEMPKKRLNDQASLWTREPFYKDEGKEFKLGKSNISQLLLYNARDCVTNKEIDEEQEQDLLDLSERFSVPLVEYYYNYMMKKHRVYLTMENTGMRIDEVRRKELSKEYKEKAAIVHARQTERLGFELNVKSAPQVYNLLYKALKFKPLKKAPTSEDAIVRLMGNHAKKAGQKEILEDILEERRIRDQRSRAINFSPDYDGRVKSSFNISATETCRSSTGILKKPIRPKKIGLAFHTIPKHGKFGKRIRSMFIPDEGKVFLQADSSQAEARVVAVLSEDWELLEAFDRIDIHRRTAGLIFNFIRTLELGPKCSSDVVDFLEKDGAERFCGKKTRHAGNYNMGKGRFMMEFNTDAQKYEIPMSISEWKAGQMLDLFHAASPKIRGVFHVQIRQALESSRVLIDPFGGVRIFNGRMDDELFKEGFANIPQRTVAHLVQGALIKIYDEIGEQPKTYISENHDAVVLQVPKNDWRPYAELMKKHFERPIDFSQYCTLKRDYKLTIPCDIEISDTNYAEMRKVKID